MSDPAVQRAIERRTRELLQLRRVPSGLFLCRREGGFLVCRGPDQDGILLLFSSPFMATDYLRATEPSGGDVFTVERIAVIRLPQLAKTWLSLGIQKAVLDRCPRCVQSLGLDIRGFAADDEDHFLKIWSVHRATRTILGEMRIRAAMTQLNLGNQAEARAHLEYVRDHFDCSVPYLQQMIGLIAGTQGDDVAKAAVMERLREFGPPFDGPLEWSVELSVAAMVGLAASFGMQTPKGPLSTTI